MRATIGPLAFLAVAGPALAAPGFNRGDAVKDIEAEIDEFAKLRGSWGGRHGGRPGNYGWGESSSSAVSPVTAATASSTISAAPYGTWTPTGYWNASATAKPSWGNSSYAGSDGSELTTYVTVTDIVSYYTTVCPYESEYTSGTEVLTTASGSTTSTIETTICSTITITTTVPTAPAYGSGSDETSSPMSPVSSDSPGAYPSSEDLNTVGNIATSSDDSSPTTIFPVPYGSYTPSGYEASSGFEASPSGGSGKPDTYTTVFVTSVVTESVYTSKCHETTTQTSGSSTLTSTYDTVSTLTSTLTSTFETTLTVTVAPGSSAPAYGDSSSVTSETPITEGSSVHPHASAPHYSVGAAFSSSRASESSFTTYTTTCSENGTSVIHTHSAPITGNATSSYPTSPVTQSESSSTPFPAGNTTTSAPGSIGTSPSTTSSSSSMPSHTGCVPCEGQPGNNPGRGGYCGYTAADNQYEVLPKTCETREYFFEITNTTIAPDGVERMALVINNQMPGPLIEANWGDTIIVHVKNSMQNNGTTIHWHGQRQNYTNEMDGVASITQCPITPGEEMTYKFVAANYGFSWYHSHLAIQTYEGVFGPMLIHGPKSTQEEYDEEVIVLQDWSHVPVDEMYDAAQTVGPRPQNGPRVLDTGLINGVNVWGDDATGSGERWSMDVTKGQTKLLRLVNTAIQSTFVFSIDSHKMKVIAMDYVPIVPYETDTIYLNNGQRYDVLVTFDQEEDNYWLRSDNQDQCATVTEAFNIKGIVHYDSVDKATPTSTTWSYTAGCNDEPLASLVPYYSIDAGAVDETINERVLIGANGGTPNLYKWTLNQVTFTSEWGHPTLESIVENGTIPDYSGALAIEAKDLGEWVYVIIDSPIPFPHPIHLHGHDFYVLAQGTGVYTPAVTLNLENPPRRDVAMMPWDPQADLGGHLVLAFKTDNPGVWLMHCHIGWHAAMGFALQIIENLEGIKDTVKETSTLKDTCSSYNAWADEYGIQTLDSGI